MQQDSVELDKIFYYYYFLVIIYQNSKLQNKFRFTFLL